MFKSIGTLLAAAALALIVAYIVPFSATDLGTNPIKEAIGFSTAKFGGVSISLNSVLAIIVTLQGFLITLAAVSLLSQTPWLMLSHSKAPLTIIDAALRNYPQAFSLFFKQPWNMTSAAVILVFLPVIIDAVQHATVQSLVVQGVANNTGTTNYVYLNTSTMMAQYEPLLSQDNGFFFGLSQIASLASVNAISAVANACSNITRACNTSTANKLASLISCGSEVDCASDITSYHDFDMTCTRNETREIWTGRWLESSVALERVRFLEGNYVHVLDWTLRRVKPHVTRDAEEPLLIAAVSCRIVGAWVTRYESQLRGTLNKTVIRRYDSVESASKENTTDVDPLSNLGRNNVRYLGSSMGYLDLALANTVVGGCLGQMDAMDLPYKCDKSLSLMSLSADPYRVENDVEMMELEMRFTAEMIMKHLLIQVMPEADTNGTCKNCSARNARWVSLPAASAFFGMILGLVMLFAGTSIYLEVKYGCKDSLISAEKLFTAFGGTCGSREPIISLDTHVQIIVDGESRDKAHFIPSQQKGMNHPYEKI
ncbi:hypothetical protein BJ741DRAFT_589273 [Chytriomyces cf. hyalinus JEL632]|nr:hypothetical protein BJ741DRAFT_589273 [Chytriomyces cf. hyalinus JEL632]